MPPVEAVKTPKVRFCVVCGNGSHREDWRNSKEGYVACDGHSTSEFEAAIAKVKAEKNPQPASTPSTPTQPPANGTKVN
jgi:hypothetical protein